MDSSGLDVRIRFHELFFIMYLANCETSTSSKILTINTIKFYLMFINLSRSIVKLALKKNELQHLEKCHRVHCHCIEKLQKAVWTRPGFKATTDAREEYKQCLQLSKKWHQKWPL